MGTNAGTTGSQPAVPSVLLEQPNIVDEKREVRMRVNANLPAHQKEREPAVVVEVLMREKSGSAPPQAESQSRF